VQTLVRQLLFFLVFFSAGIVSADQTEESITEKATVVWLRPPEANMAIDGVTIASGPMLENMKHLASHLPEFRHKFEAYPVKRALSLVKKGSSNNNVYCFFGASLNEERKEWGYFSTPTSINLPILVLGKKAVIDSAQATNSEGINGPFPLISIQKLLEANFNTVLYEGVTNAYGKTVKQYQTVENVIVLNGLGKDLGLHTIALLKTGRIDFGYVGHSELNTLSPSELAQFTTFQAEELSFNTRGTKRLFCSLTPLGNKVVEALDRAVRNILSREESANILRDINFEAEGYSPMFKTLFESRWSAFQKLVSRGELSRHSVYLNVAEENVE